MNFKSSFLSAANPLAITMWDFSWLERRWPGAGYEDYDLVLDELVERGYNAIRIDPFPHLLAANPEGEWELRAENMHHNWGSPGNLKVKPLPALIEFLGRCRNRNIGVALSSWFRKTLPYEIRLNILTAEDHASVWIKTLELIESHGLSDTIVYLDPCNEWPCDGFAPFFTPPGHPADWSTPRSLEWMKTVTTAIRSRYPDLPLTFSTVTAFDKYETVGPECLDFFEIHLWMALNTDFNGRVGYNFQKDATGFENVVAKAERLYRTNPKHWQSQLCDIIDRAASYSRKHDRLLATTECWAIVDYKDWPGLDWGWVKELNELGTLKALETRRWAAVATSNFAAPQFRGMWRDVEWHQRLTKAIRNKPLQVQS